MFAYILDFVRTSSLISVLVLCWLAFYFLLTLWVFFYRFSSIRSEIVREKQSLRQMSANVEAKPRSLGVLKGLIETQITQELLHIWKHTIMQKASAGLTILAIIASTSPFIGLFGTVVEILEAFSKLGGSGQVSFDVMAPVISKALVATAAGILTAIPAYSFHLVLKRKLYELNIALQMELDLLLSRQSTKTMRF